MHSDHPDIGTPPLHATVTTDGLLAMLAQRPGALCMRIPDEPVKSTRPATTTKPSTSSRPLKGPISSPRAPKPDSARSTDQGRAGASSTTRPAPAAPAPTRPTTTADAAERAARRSRPSTPAATAKEDTPKDDKPAATTPNDPPKAAIPTDDAPRSTPMTTADGAERRAARHRTTASGADTRPQSPAAGDVGEGDELSVQDEIALLKQNAARARAAAAEREAEQNTAEHLDQALTQQQLDQLRASQDQLAEDEDTAREAHVPADQPAPRNRIEAEHRAAASERADEDVADLRRDYVAEHDYWVDADGTVYAASVDARGNLVLERTQSIPAADGQPPLETTRTATIDTERNRTDVAVTRNVPDGPRDVRQTRTETVESDRDGRQTSAQVRVEQERDNADGSSERSITQEDYDASGVATERLQEQVRTDGDGNDTTDRTTTTFADDGTTPERVVAEHASEQGDASSSRTTTTRYGDSGQPTNQLVVESSVDAEGAEAATRAETGYGDAGSPEWTHISRSGEHGEDVPASEYVTWDADTGEVERKVTGGPDTTRSEFEQFLDDGVQPDVQELPDEPQPPSMDDTNDSGRRTYAGHGGAARYAQDLADWEEDVLAPWQAEVDRIEAENERNRLVDVDPDEIVDAEEALRWTRQDDDRFTSESLGSNLVDPLEPSTQLPSVFDVPAQVRARASAQALDRSTYATDQAAFDRLSQEQADYEERVARATSDQVRERIMREYFDSHDYWIDRGSRPDAEPVLMAAAWSTGAPESDLFGADRASRPHAVAARTGIQGVDDMGQDATIDVVQRFYADGSSDDVVRTSYDGPAGASRTTVTGEHTNAAGVVVQRDRSAESVVARTEQGLPPLAVTEVSRERFHAETGNPYGAQYFAVAQSDETMTSLEERSDLYDIDGVIYDTKIDTTSMSRNYDADLTDDFLAANRDVMSQAREDEFSPNEDGEVVTVPPAGSYLVESHTDIDYDDEGVAVFQQVDETSTQVADAGDDNHNGVRVTQTDTTRVTGERGGSTAIFDDAGARAAAEDVTTTITSTEFDPDAGQAGGNRSTGHQFREISEITLHQTIGVDGTPSDEWATPLTVQTLREGFDDDWQFDEKYLKTDASGQVVTNDDGEPQYFGEGDAVRAADGSTYELERDDIHHEDLDFADKFEEFMEGWGGRIVGVAAIVAGIGGAVFTGGASLALTAVGVGLASTSLAYTALNYSQGEASGWDLALSGAGVVLAGLPAITGVKQLVGASRGARAFTAARAAGAADDVARSLADDVMRTATQNGKGLNTTLRVGNTADNAMDTQDAFDATRAALQGDFWGAGMMLLAVGGGAAAGRVRTRIHGGATGARDTAVPDLDGPAAGSPAAAQGAPGVRLPEADRGIDTPRFARPDRSSNTGVVPMPDPDGVGGDGTTDVGGARGPAVDASVTPAARIAGSDVSIESLLASGQRHPGTNGKLATKGEPGSVLYAMDADGEVTGYSLIGEDGVADQLVRRQLDGSWSVEYPQVFANGSRGFPKGVQRQAASDLQVPTDIDSGSIERAARSRSAELRAELPTTTLPARQVGHVLRVHHPSYRVEADHYRMPEAGYTRHDGVDATENYSQPRSTFDAELDATDVQRLIEDTAANGIVTTDARGDAYRIVSDDLGSIGRMADGSVANRLEVIVDADGTIITAYPINEPNLRRAVRGDQRSLELLHDPAGRPAGVEDVREFGRFLTRRNRTPLEPPLAREVEVRGNLRSGHPQALVSHAALTGQLQPGVHDSMFARGITADGRVAIDTPSINRATELESIIQTNPELVAQLGGADAVRANPALLEGRSINVRRTSGEVESGWIARGVRGDGKLDTTLYERSSMDLGEYLARRAQLDPSFDARSAMRSVIAADPSLLQGRPLRLRRSDTSIANGNAAHNISDGWYVTGYGTGPDGQPVVHMAKDYQVRDLSGRLRREARANGQRRRDNQQLVRTNVPLSQVLDYNLVRLQGDHGQLPRLQVRYGRPDGPVIGVDRDLQPGRATERADQAVVHTQAALDYLYSRYGYVPSGGDITLVIDAEGTHNNASMQSLGNVLRIGTHDSNGAAFDPSVIMHELGHKLVDDYTAGHYGEIQAGSIHEGIADVMAAGWTHDPIVGRVFDARRGAIRDIRTGENLIGSTSEWNGIAQARGGVEPHTGSGVVTGAAARIAGDMGEPGLGWTETADLFADALRTGAMRNQMDFDSLADGVRLAAARRYGIGSDEYQLVSRSLARSGMHPMPASNAAVSRITSRGTIEHGWRVIAQDADRGTVMIANAAGQYGHVPAERLLVAGARDLRVNSSGWIDAIDAAPPQRSQYSNAARGAAPTTQPQVHAGDVARRVVDHLTITQGATLMSSTGVQLAQVDDREDRAEAQRQAEIEAIRADLADLQYLLGTE